MRYDPPDTKDTDAMENVFGEMFNIPEADLDNQLVEISSGETQSSPIQQTPTETSDPTSDLGDLF
jgi:hypothetical protein